ncbi:MAG: glycosyltransferase family 9 protein [Leptospirales bacterium]
MDHKNLLRPIFPEKSLFWNGFPLFHVRQFSASFSGKLFFVLGQGLGDHVNGFRVLYELRKSFPQAEYIAYADRRWEELVLRMEGVSIRWYPHALDPRSGVGTNDPYPLSHDEIRRDIQKNPGQSFLAYDHFPMPDRHARGETTLEATSRSISLNLGDRARPFFPIVDFDRRWAKDFLKKKRIKRGRFAVIAPFSWPNKMWPKEHFSRLIDTLREKYGLRSVLVAYPEMGVFENSGVVMAYDLTLGQIGGLLSHAGLYVGLDSGPSHMAAAFDLPMVVIFVERTTIPFEVRAMTPWALHVVEGFEKNIRDPTLRTVEEAVSYVWNHRRDLPEVIPDCPACLRKAYYIAGTTGESLEFLCVCGLKITGDPLHQMTFPKRARSQYWEIDNLRMPRDERVELTAALDLGSIYSFRETEKALRSYTAETVEVTLDIGQKNFQKSSQESNSGPEPEVVLSQDALVLWMVRLGFLPREVKNRPRSVQVWIFRKFRKDQLGMFSEEWSVSIPWSGGTLKLLRVSDYVRLYSFEKWGRSSDLVGVVKHLSSLGYYSEAYDASWVAVRTDPSYRSLRWLGKSLFFLLLEKGKIRRKNRHLARICR